MVLAEAANHVGFWQDYWSVQTDPAHLLAEFGFSILFELLQVVFVLVFWAKILKPRFKRELHREIDAEHGVEHKEET